MEKCKSGMEMSKELSEKVYESPEKYFESLKKLDEECDTLRDTQEKLMASLVGATVLKEDKVDSTPTEDDEDVYLEVLELRDKLRCKERWLRRFQLNVASEIHYLDSRISRIILSKRYIEGKLWKDIEKDLSYSPRRVMDLHKEALKDFKETFSDKFN